MRLEKDIATVEKRIEIRDIDTIDLLGANDTNLQLLKEKCSLDIKVRGNEICLVGEQAEIDFTEKIMGEMISIVLRKGFVDKNDIMTMINLRRVTEPAVIGEIELGSTILFTRTQVIKPRTSGQEEYFKNVMEHDMTFAIGPAGTGKTYLAVAFAVSALKNREVNKIVLTRPAVEAGENLGFLPGDLKEKVDPYLAPLYDALKIMMSHDKVKLYLEQKTIEIVPLAFMRGRTLENAFIILDEAQNTTSVQMQMFLTRMGVNSKVIITGDVTQIDLPKHEKSGLIEASRILKDVDGIGTVLLKETDVLRHRLVKDIIMAYNGENGK